MSKMPSRPSNAEQPEGAAPETGEADPIERRESRREKRGKNTLILRELALIAALCLLILAFNLNWGTAEGNRDVAAREQDQIVLRDVRVTPPEPEPPEPEPQQPQPEPQVPKETPRREVPDEQVQETPDVTAEPIRKMNTSPTQQQTTPAPKTSPKPQSKPKPPTNKVFNKGAVDRNPQMEGSLTPEYPKQAKQAGIEGTVVVQFVVDESGRPQDIQVLRSPNDMLAEAAREAVQEASFSPGRQNGQAVKVRMAQPVVFRLE